MAEQAPPPAAAAEPPERTLPPEAVEAATAAIEDAEARAAAAEPFPEREQLLAGLLETKGILNELREEIRKIGEIREKDLTDKQLFAVQLANRSIAGQFFAFLEKCIEGTLGLPEGIGGGGEEEGGGGGEADHEEEQGGEAEEGGNEAT